MSMSISKRVEMGLMAGVLATVVMSIAVIAVSAISAAWNGFFPIQWFNWVAAVFGTNGIPYQIAEMGVVYLVVLGIIAGLIYAFAFKTHTVSQGLAFGAIAWFLTALYVALYTAPQLSGPLGSLGVTTSVELLLPLALCFGLWGAAMGYVGKRYVG
jgi:hypothetical protein